MEENDVASGVSSESSRESTSSKEVGAASDNNSETKGSPESNYSQLFKNTGKTIESITQQRKTIFQQEHKEKHNELVDKNRELSELFEEREMGNLLGKDVEDEGVDEVGNQMVDEVYNEMEKEVEYDMENENYDCETEEQENEESMEIEGIASKKKKVVQFRLTTSRWLTEIPEDLSDKWLVKFCPKGSRRLILCNHRTTKVFDKYGIFQMEFDSNLPGGGGIPEFSSSTPGLTALDSVFHSPTRTFFILDVMVWNSASFLDCEAELRHCWIRSKYRDSPECFEEYGQNSFKFEVVLDYPADPNTIALQLSQYDTNCAVACEGVLFYHKEVPYIPGNTDCVTWLKPFMLQELLNIAVPRPYEQRKPPAYVNLKSYLEFLEERAKRLKSKRKSKQKMRILAQREMMAPMFETETMDTQPMGTSTIEAPAMETTSMETPTTLTASMDTPTLQTSTMDIAP